MSIRDVGVLRLGLDTTSVGCLNLPNDCGWNEHLADYINNPGGCDIGDILFIPTYRLEEVEEIVEPEKPGVPVEPYVGLSWEYGGRKHVVVEVAPDYIQVAARGYGMSWGVLQFFAMDGWDRLFSALHGYPRTPSTPAITRRQKKWVKIEHPEVSSDGLA